MDHFKLKFYAPRCNASHFLLPYLERDGMLTDEPGKADYLLCPFGFEFIVEYTNEQMYQMGFSVSDVREFKSIAEQLNSMSVKTGKPMVVIHYRDPSHDFGFENALVFRTSYNATNAGSKTFGLPAFVEGFPQNDNWVVRPKKSKPSVSFRGQSAPLMLPFKSELRIRAGKILTHFGLPGTIRQYYNNGYMLRRSAIRSLLKLEKLIDLDIALNQTNNALGYKEQYLKSFTENDYFIAVSGHGNYSFRLFEIMREGRIPVFVNTDCLLPCQDCIDWKKLLLWIEPEDVNRVAQIVLDTHNSLHPDDYCSWQYQIRDHYQKYLTTEGFYHYWINFLNNRALAVNPLCDYNF
ncbi:MAG TPA: exostosin family protein [Phnomibacter sp.]|nr:exostosin family protein [Phnomibacter sp.]